MTEQRALTPLDEAEPILRGLMVVRDTLAPDLSPGELELFALVASRSGLDPFARQIYAVKRKGRMTIQTGIDGYRSIAARTGEYDGQDEPIFGDPCGCGREPKDHPLSSTVRVYRKGMSRPVGATAFWHEYKPEDNDFMWRRMPHVMLAKVAEALALRKAFPWDPTRKVGIGSDIYTDEEMAQAGNTAPAPGPSLSERVEARAGQAGIVGMTVRAFASAVGEMDPAYIREIREDLFPYAGGVVDLSDEQRSVLYERLVAGLRGDVEGEAVEVSPETMTDARGDGLGTGDSDGLLATPNGEIAEMMVDAATVSGDPPEDPEEYVACGNILPPPLGDNDACILEHGHGGPHQSDAGSRWPNRKGSRR